MIDDRIAIIENNINYIIDKALENKNNIRYYLEKLPMIEDYDNDVHEYINQIEYYVNDRKVIDMIRNDIIEYYYINWNTYKNMFQ